MNIKTNCDNFLAWLMKKFIHENYKGDLKIATTELHQNQRNPNPIWCTCDKQATEQISSSPSIGQTIKTNNNSNCC